MSAALDLRRDGDLARFEALLAEADVLVHGLRPGALARLGYPDPALRALNPALCVATVDAYGSRLGLGPQAPPHP